MKLYPAILTGDIQQVQHYLDIANSLEDCDIVHIDLIDGFFADNMTLTPADLISCEFGDLKCDLHIMAVDPEDVVNEIVEYAALLPVRAIIAQVEKMGSEHSYIEAVRRQGWQAGLSLDIDTAVDSVDSSAWPQLQIVQVMGVHAGEQGQAFINRSLSIVDELVAMRKLHQLQFELLVDGGVRPDLISKLTAHHVDSCAVGSFIWKSSEPQEKWQEISR